MFTTVQSGLAYDRYMRWYHSPAGGLENCLSLTGSNLSVMEEPPYTLELMGL